jgi:hypothetical protein
VLTVAASCVLRPARARQKAAAQAATQAATAPMPVRHTIVIPSGPGVAPLNAIVPVGVPGKTIRVMNCEATDAICRLKVNIVHASHNALRAKATMTRGLADDDARRDGDRRGL